MKKHWLSLHEETDLIIRDLKALRISLQSNKQKKRAHAQKVIRSKKKKPVRQ